MFPNSELIGSIKMRKIKLSFYTKRILIYCHMDFITLKLAIILFINLKKLFDNYKEKKLHCTIGYLTTKTGK